MGVTAEPPQVPAHLLALAQRNLQRRWQSASPRDVDMAARYLGGQTIRDIGSHFGVSYQRVCQVLDYLCVPRRRGKVTSFMTDQAIELYRGGMTLMEVGAQLGVSARTIRRWLESREEPTRKAGPPHKLDTKRVVAMYRQGATLAEIAHQMATTANTVLAYLRRANEPRRRPGQRGNNRRKQPKGTAPSPHGPDI